jgi:hypothetical protein
MNTSFVQLLQISIGNKNSIDLQTKNWPHLFEISNKQSILGITYVGLEKTKKIGIFVNPILFTKWYGLYESLKKRNEIVEEDCRWVTQYFDEKGFNSCILKGQGLNLLYKNADEELVRTAGDVDIWLMPKAIEDENKNKNGNNSSLSCRRISIYRFCDSIIPNCHTIYHHLDFPIEGKNVEVHFTPSWMFCPWHNNRLQKFFEKEWGNRVLTEKGFYVPSTDFNLVYILIHIYRHIFDEGVGLRQLLDYYFVLKNSTEEQRLKAYAFLQTIGMNRLTKGVMWIMKEAFAMESSYLLCAPDKRIGKKILTEVMIGGNFGHSDERYKHKNNSITNNLGVGNLLLHVQRNFKYLWYFPSEVFWSVPFHIWHYLWRKKNGWR